jgi:hypothetical protein
MENMGNERETHSSAEGKAKFKVYKIIEIYK